MGTFGRFMKQFLQVDYLFGSGESNFIKPSNNLNIANTILLLAQLQLIEGLRDQLSGQF